MNGTQKASKRNQRIIYSVAISIILVVLATAVTLVAVFTNKQGDIPANSEMENPPIVTPKVTYICPVKDYTVIRQASFDKLVFMPSLNMWKTHNGIDFKVNSNKNVFAITDGVVKNVDKTTLEGVVVTIEHANGLVSVYKSLEKAVVKAGDKVTGGTEIGQVGCMMTEKSDGEHLHLEMLASGKYVNPIDYIDIIEK